MTTDDFGPTLPRMLPKPQNTKYINSGHKYLFDGAEDSHGYFVWYCEYCNHKCGTMATYTTANSPTIILDDEQVDPNDIKQIKKHFCKGKSISG